jgi:hypothetical protein
MEVSETCPQSKLLFNRLLRNLSDSKLIGAEEVVACVYPAHRVVINLDRSFDRLPRLVHLGNLTGSLGLLEPSLVFVSHLPPVHLRWKTQVNLFNCFREQRLQSRMQRCLLYERLIFACGWWRKRWTRIAVWGGNIEIVRTGVATSRRNRPQVLWNTKSTISIFHDKQNRFSAILVCR